MRHFSFLALFMVMGAQAAEFESELPSSIPGVSIPNAHLMAQDQGILFRGNAPNGMMDQLMGLGVNRVLIFKNETGGEVAEEREELLERQIAPDRIHHIPFRWKKLGGFKTACEQTIQALQIMVTSYQTSGDVLYLHCTLGEDRTGHLAGLFRVLVQGWTAKKAFQEEMCENGYEAGNPKKPAFVVDAIRAEITPVFLQLSAWMKLGVLTQANLNPSICSVPTLPQPQQKVPVCSKSSKWPKSPTK